MVTQPTFLLNISSNEYQIINQQAKMNMILENAESGQIFKTRNNDYVEFVGYTTDYFENKLQKLGILRPVNRTSKGFIKNGGTEYTANMCGKTMEFVIYWYADIVGMVCSKKQVRNAVINTIDIYANFYNGVYMDDISGVSDKYGWLIYKPAARESKQLIFKKKDRTERNYYLRTKADYEVLCKYLNKKLGVQYRM